MSWRGYLLITELPPGWTNEERQVAFAAVRTMGKQDGPDPCRINHSRLSLDGRAMLVEAEFAEGEITREAVVDLIAAALGVNREAVDARIDYLVFAGFGSSWSESHDQVLAYLASNLADWEEI